MTPKKRVTSIFFSVCLLTLLLPVFGLASAEIRSEDYTPLLEYIAMEDLQEPLVVFQDNAGDFDSELNRENIAYLNQNKPLLQKIKARLKGETLHWKLAASNKRLLVVPETRPEYADLFQNYCRNAIDYVLKRIQAPNPYRTIRTVQGPLTKSEADEGGGITVYLVHNVADEYIEEYVFFNQDNSATKIKIKLQNRVFNGIVGSYSSKLIIGENNHFEFAREPYTVWQNSARNPLNVFIAPIEETLHIVLRQATENAIRAQLDQVKPERLSGVQEVVKEWMAVEEAIVGGLVAKLMPEVFHQFVHLPDPRKLAEALAERDSHTQYRYLDNGIRVVSDLGLKQALDLYKNDPDRFRMMVHPDGGGKIS